MTDTPSHTESTPKVVKPRRTLFRKIFNTFIFLFNFLIILLLLFLGFSQTATFREFLRTEVLDILNGEIKGTAHIERIDGTIFSSIILRDVSLRDSSQEIIQARKIEVFISPHKVFFKTIYIRKVQLEDVGIRLLKDANGELNIAKVFASDKPKEEDTTASPFEFQIDVADLKLTNLDVSLRSETLKNPQENYEFLNPDDLHFRRLSLDATARVNLDAKRFEFNLKDFYTEPNLVHTRHILLDGDFLISDSEVIVGDLQLSTNNSNLTLDLAAENINVFGPLTQKELGEFTYKLKLNAEPFDFADLKSFVSGVEILGGQTTLKTVVDGTLNRTTVRDLKAQFNGTSIDMTASVENINDPDKMFIRTNFRKSTLKYADLEKLLPSTVIPKFEGVPDAVVDTLSFAGAPTNFTAGISIALGNGRFKGDLKLDVRNGGFIYDLKASSSNLRLDPFIGNVCVLNASRINMTGRGLDIRNLVTDIDIDASGSQYAQFEMSTLNVTAKGGGGILNTRINGKQLEQTLTAEGNLDFQDVARPTYDLIVNGNNIDIATITQDSGKYSDINFELFASGSGLNPDKMNASANFKTFQSRYIDSRMKDIQAHVSFSSAPETGKIITLESNLATFGITGNFEFQTISDVFLSRLDTLTQVVMHKIDHHFPFIDVAEKSTRRVNENAAVLDSSKPIDIRYTLDFKDLSPLSPFLGDNSLLLMGSLYGKLDYDRVKGFHFSANVDTLSGIFGRGDSAYLFDNVMMRLKLAYTTTDIRFEKISASLNFGMSDFYLNQKDKSNAIKNFKSRVSLYQGKLIMMGHVNMNTDTYAELEMNTDFNADTLLVHVDVLSGRYNDYVLRNRHPFSIALQDRGFVINNLNLYRGNAHILAEGKITQDGSQDLNVSILDLDLSDLQAGILFSDTTGVVDGKVNIITKVSGSFGNPTIDVDAAINGMTFKKTDLGDLRCTLKYKDKVLVPNLALMFNDGHSDGVRLKIDGMVPVDMSFASVEERFPLPEPLELNIYSDSLSLKLLGNMMPMISNTSGFLSSDLQIKGNYPNLNYSGYVRLLDGKFRAVPNNLNYNASAYLRMRNSTLFIDSVMLSNQNDVETRGVLRSKGEVEFEGFSLASAYLMTNGNLTVLGPQTKSANPMIFGDLYIGTDKNFTVAYEPGSLLLKGKVIVKRSNLTVMTGQSGYSSSGGNFVYRIMEPAIDSSGLDMAALTDSLRSLSMRKAEKMKMDIDIGVRLEDNSYMTIYFSKETNQFLVTHLEGDIQFQMKNDVQNIQGKLKLLDESKLEMLGLKTFNATGSIAFESDITDPFLDVVALYKSYYTFYDRGTPREDEVGVKIKLKGALSELTRKFSEAEDNIALYVGRDNIEKDVIATGYDKSDAVWFILTGKLRGDLTATDQASAAGSVGAFEGTATSLAGSLLGSLLNNYLGDFVKSLEVRSAADGPRFTLSGRFKDLRYTFGGSTNLFQDLSAANFRFEYPVINNLILRLERKEATNELNFNYEMINEVGVKYRFEF